MSRPQRRRVISDRLERDIRLQSLGLTEDLLLNAVSAGAFARDSYADGNYPACYAGLSNWAVIVKRLRDDLLPEWARYDRNKLEGVISSQGTVILVESGDERTGDASAESGASTKYPKGDAIGEAVERNYLLDFNDPERERLNERIRAGEGLRSTYFLLHALAGEEIRCELSRPLSIASGFVDEWDERIILTPIPSNSPLVIPEDEPVIPAVDVRRRG